MWSLGSDDNFAVEARQSDVLAGNLQGGRGLAQRPESAPTLLSKTVASSTLAGKKLLYAIGGPVDVIEEHRRRFRPAPDEDPPLRTSLGDLFEVCERLDMHMHVISTHWRAGVVRRGRFVLEHRPKTGNRGRLGHYAADVAYARFLVKRGLELGAQTAVVESGVVDYFLMSLLTRAKIAVVPLLHGTLWPHGYPPRRFSGRVRSWLNGRFFRRWADSVICVSPIVARQVRVAAGCARPPVRQVRLQLDRRAFEGLSAPPPHASRPFGVLFTGRIERGKGVFDILEMVDTLDKKYPGELRWYVLGDGSQRDALAHEIRARGMSSIVELPGWLDVGQMRAYYEKAHLCVVPTRSELGEGMAMAAVEAVIAGRPVVTSSVVPAVEVLGPACIRAQVDDAGSYAAAIERLMLDKDLYAAKCAACSHLGHEFFDSSLGLASAVVQAMGGPALETGQPATQNQAKRLQPQKPRSRPLPRVLPVARIKRPSLLPPRPGTGVGQTTLLDRDGPDVDVQPGS